jgi:translation initiation factor 1
MSKKPLTFSKPLSHNPFAELAARRDALPPFPDLEKADEAVSATAKELSRGPLRAVLRLTHKGRGGKEVTLVEKLGLPDDELERWCKDLKTALGCGGAAEGGSLVLQGDQRERLPALLEARGVSKITVG